ncbi:hypothetical protein CPB84DRAFT_1684641, partial [Gymnopilus junonius]
VKSDTKDSMKLEKAWPVHACLDVKGGLTGQTSPICALCHKAIKLVKKALVVEHAWLELYHAKAYKRLVLSMTVKPLLKKDIKIYDPLQKRTTEDDKFIQVTGKWVINHLSIWHGKPCNSALTHIAGFQLGVNAVCIVCVAALLENDMYVYPRKWGMLDKGQEIWLAKGSKTDIQIYLNQALIDTIKDTFFAMPTAFSFKFKDQYISFHPTLLEPELMIPLIALCLYAAIWEWHKGKKIGKANSNAVEKFEGDQFKAVYDQHIEVLTSLKTRINTYHALMSTIYSRVMAGNVSSDLGAKSQGNALTILDLSGLD